MKTWGRLTASKNYLSAVAVLESLYYKGMTGWGKNHSDSFDVALSTGLDPVQIKVSLVLYCDHQSEITASTLTYRYPLHGERESM